MDSPPQIKLESGSASEVVWNRTALVVDWIWFVAWLTPPLSAQHYTTKVWESPVRRRKFFGGAVGIFRSSVWYAVVNERGSSVIAFHLLPHSETVLQGRESWIYKKLIKNSVIFVFSFHHPILHIYITSSIHKLHVNIYVNYYNTVICLPRFLQF